MSLNLGPSAAPAGAPAGTSAPTPPITPAPGGTPTPPAPAPDRPSWLPEGINTPEELAKAYKEQISKPSPRIDTEMLQKTIAEKGSFDEAALKHLESLGVTPAQANIYEKGLKAEIAEYTNQVFGAAGGEEKYWTLMTWSKSLPADEQAALDAAVNSGDANRAKLAVDGLAAKFRLKNGQDPRQIGGRQAPTGPQAFASVYERNKAYSDPRMFKDEAYTSDVVARALAMKE